MIQGQLFSSSNGVALTRNERVAPSCDEVTDANLQQAARLTTLVRLYLDGPNVTDDRLAILKGHNYLAGVDLMSTRVTDQGLAHLETLPTLKFLTIEKAQVTRAGIEHFRKAAPRCEVDWQPE